MLSQRCRGAALLSALLAAAADALGPRLVLVAEAQLVLLPSDTAVRVTATEVAHVDHVAFDVEVGVLASF
jgi:hypothetical protein